MSLTILTFGVLASFGMGFSLAVALPMNHDPNDWQHPDQEKTNERYPYVPQSQPSVETDLHVWQPGSAGNQDNPSMAHHDPMQHSFPMWYHTQVPYYWPEQRQQQPYHAFHEGGQGNFDDAEDEDEYANVEYVEGGHQHPDANAAAAENAGRDAFYWIYRETANSRFRRIFGFARTSFGMTELTADQLRGMILANSPEWRQLERVYEERTRYHSLRTQARQRFRKDENDAIALRMIEEVGMNREELMSEVRYVPNRPPMNPNKRKYIMALIRRLEGEIKEYERTRQIKPNFDMSNLRASYRHQGDDEDPSQTAGNAEGNRIIKLLYDIRISLQSFLMEPIERRDRRAKLILEQKINELNEWREKNDTKRRDIHMPEVELRDDDDNNNIINLHDATRTRDRDYTNQAASASGTQQPSRHRKGKERAEEAVPDRYHRSHPSEAQQVRHALQLSRLESEARMNSLQDRFQQPWIANLNEGSIPNIAGGNHAQWIYPPATSDQLARPWHGNRKEYISRLFGDGTDDEEGN